MSDPAAAAPESDSTPAAPAPAKTPVKKATKPRTAAKPADHPKYIAMVAAAVGSLKERGGSSRQAILKYIMANYNVGDEVTKINARIKTALKSGVTDGTLKQAKGTGATGSFRLGDKKVAADKPKPKKVMKPKTVVTKKPKSPKKVAVKKPETPTKKAAASKPKKVKIAAAKPKKAKSPAKKAANKPKAAKPKTPKKAGAKKPAAKKAAKE
ncbi:histone H1-delta-like [Littorina saxatilis]|uniref:H15 domain-containing protein n=1 Tax=Littorina saxatilis TaxID=31220 RepID=A0AAN9G1I2_9CAEN